MMTTIGVAVGLAAQRRHPPVRPSCPTPAEVLLGLPLPDAPSVMNDAHRLASRSTGDRRSPRGCPAYGRGWYASCDSARDRWPLGRTIAWYSGLAVLAFGAISGLTVYGQTVFSLHMSQHMTLSMVAPVLLVLAAPITLALRALPAARASQPAGAREWLLSACRAPSGGS